MNGIGQRSLEVLQKLSGLHFPRGGEQLDEGEFAGTVHSHKKVEAALRRLDFGDVDVEIADGVAFKFLLGGFVALRIGQARNSVAQQATVQGGASEVGNGWLECIEAVIQRQESMASEGDNDGFFFEGED